MDKATFYNARSGDNARSGFLFAYLHHTCWKASQASLFLLVVGGALSIANAANAHATSNVPSYAASQSTAHTNKPRITVAVASNFRFGLQQVIKNSDYWSQQDVRVVTGSSGVLYAQILKGAPFDVFLSADKQRPEALVAEGLGKTSIPYAVGKLALWPVPKTIMQNPMTTPAKIQQLLAAHSGKFAIAHPQLAPFGSAAKAYLDEYAANFDVLPNLVFGNNITQAFQFVDSGNATQGLIAESLLIQAGIQFKQDKYQNYLLLKQDRYDAIVQHLLVVDRAEYMKTSKKQTSPKQKAEKYALQQQAKAFSQFIISTEVQSQLTQLGYLAVTEMPYE